MAPDLHALGIVKPILPSGVFPESKPKSVGPTIDAMTSIVRSHSWTQAQAKHSEHDINYTSYLENQALAEETLNKEYERGFLEWYPSAREAEERYGEITLSKVACLVKPSAGAPIGVLGEGPLAPLVRNLGDLRQG